MRSNEQVLTGLHCWPPDVTSCVGVVLGPMSGGGGSGVGAGGPHVPCLEEGRSEGLGRGLYSEVKSIIGKGHMETPPPVDRMTDRHD